MFYFNALIGLLFTFPSRYLFTIDLQEYLALRVSSRGFPQAFRVLRYSRRVAGEINCFRLQDCHPLWFGFPADLTNNLFFNSPLLVKFGTATPLQPPAPSGAGFGLFPFRSPLLRKSQLFSLPPGTEMFHFPGCAVPT